MSTTSRHAAAQARIDGIIPSQQPMDEYSSAAGRHPLCVSPTLNALHTWRFVVRGFLRWRAGRAITIGSTHLRLAASALATCVCMAAFAPTLANAESLYGSDRILSTSLGNGSSKAGQPTLTIHQDGANGYWKSAAAVPYAFRQALGGLGKSSAATHRAGDSAGQPFLARVPDESVGSPPNSAANRHSNATGARNFSREGESIRAEPTGIPRIIGNAVAGESLTADTSSIMDSDGLTSPAFTYIWQRVIAGVASPAETESTAIYVLSETDAGFRLRVTVEFTDDEGNSHALASEDTDIVDAPAMGEPAIEGTLRVGETLSVDTSAVMDSNGLTAPNHFQYLWQRQNEDGDEVVFVSSGETYQLVEEDRGATIHLILTVTDDDGYEVLRSIQSDTILPRTNVEPDGLPIILGGAVVGLTLTATISDITDDNGLTNSTFAYQWQTVESDGVHNNIPRAATPTYRIRGVDADKRIRLSVRFTDDDEHEEELFSLATQPVAATQPRNIVATGKPVVFGTAQVDNTLVADTAAIMDADGLIRTQFRYQWQRIEENADSSPTDIADATSYVYRIGAEDEGSKIRVVVRFTDDYGRTEETFSDATAAVTATGVSPANPHLSIFGQSAPIIEPAEGVANMTFTAVLSAAQSEPVTFEYSFVGSAAEEEDFAQHPDKEVTIAAGDTAAAIVVEVSRDAVAERDGETVEAVLANPSSGVSLGISSAIGRIVDPEEQIEVSATTPHSVYNRDDGETEISFSLALQKDASVFVQYNWRVVATEPGVDGESGMAHTEEGVVAFLAGRSVPVRPPSVTFDSVLPLGSEISVQLMPLTTGVGAAVVPVQLAAGESAIVEAEWIIASRSEVARSSQEPLINAVDGFARAVATGIVNGVWRRANAHRSREVNSQAIVGGFNLDKLIDSSDSTSQRFRQAGRLVGIEAVSPVLALIDAGDGNENPDPVDGDIDAFRDWAGLPAGGDAGRTRFHFGPGEDDESDRQMTVWGNAGAAAYKSVLDSGSSTKGDWSNVLLGIDFGVRADLMLGVALSRSSGLAGITETLQGGHTDIGSAEMEMTAIFPYFHRIIPSGLGIWGAFGLGSGSLEFNNGDGTVDSGMSMQLIAAGVRSESWRLPLPNHDLSLKSDFFFAKTGTDEDRGSRVVRKVDADSLRLRVAAEVEGSWLPDAGQGTSHLFEMGTRIDGGDGASGIGLDLATSFRASSSSGWSVEWQAGVLALHSDSNFEEWNAGIDATYDPGVVDRGIRVTMSPSWNSPRKGVAGPAWDAATLANTALSDSGAAVEIRISLGTDAVHNLAVATAYGAVMAGDSGRRMRLGADIRGQHRRFRSLGLTFFGERKERSSSPPINAVMLECQLGF